MRLLFACLCAGAAVSAPWLAVADEAVPAATDQLEQELDQKAAVTPPAVEGDAPAAGQPKRWWSIAVTAELAHNLARERPAFTQAISFDPSFTLPWEFSLGLHLGGSATYSYGRENGGRGEDIAYWVADFDVSSLSLSRKIWTEEYTGISISGSLAMLVPYTSRFSGIKDKWYLGLKPGLRLGKTFDFGQGGKLSLGYTLGYQKNFHQYATYLTVEEQYNLVEHRVSNGGSLRYEVWDLSLAASVGFNSSWIYERSYQEQRSNSLSYQVEAGYTTPVKGLALALGMTTAGPERRNGGYGDDRLWPGDPRFTQIYFDVAYSY